MALDVTALAVFLMLAFLGYRSGLTSQVIRLGALVAVVAASPTVAAIIRESFFGEVRVGEPVVEGLSVFVAGLVIYFGISLAGWLAVRTMRKASPSLSKADRAAGGLVGAVKAGVIVYLLVFVAIFVEKGLEKTDPDDHLKIRNSELTTWVKGHNLLAPWHLPELQRVQEMVRVADVAAAEGKMSKIRENAVASDVLRRERVQAILKDERLKDTILNGGFAEMLGDGRVRDLMRDDDVMRAADAVDWDELLEALQSSGDKSSLDS
ncbi:MAG: CvpA family protein [bacterium]